MGYDGVVKGKYEWGADTKNKAADADMGEAITKYGWSDGKKKVDIYIEDEGLKGITKDDIKTTSGEKEATIEIANFGGKKRALPLKGLSNEIDGVDVALKPATEPPRLVIKLKKKEE